MFGRALAFTGARTAELDNIRYRKVIDAIGKRIDKVDGQLINFYLSKKDYAYYDNEASREHIKNSLRIVGYIIDIIKEETNQEEKVKILKRHLQAIKLLIQKVAMFLTDGYYQEINVTHYKDIHSELKKLFHKAEGSKLRPISSVILANLKTMPEVEGVIIDDLHYLLSDNTVKTNLTPFFIVAKICKDTNSWDDFFELIQESGNLLRSCINELYQDRKDSEEKLLLTEACYSGRADIIKLLIEYGAKLDIPVQRENEPFYPLHAVIISTKTNYDEQSSPNTIFKIYKGYKDALTFGKSPLEYASEEFKKTNQYNVLNARILKQDLSQSTFLLPTGSTHVGRLAAEQQQKGSQHLNA